MLLLLATLSSLGIVTSAQTQTKIDWNTQIKNWPAFTVATLPTNAVVNQLDVVVDGNGSSCTVGGGTTRVLCQWTGSTWAVVAGGSGGVGPISLSQLVPATAVNNINNGTNQQTWQFGAFTGNQTGFEFTEPVQGVGSGNILVRFSTQPGSTTSALQADVSGNGVFLNSSGVLTAIGTGGLGYSSLLNFFTACLTHQFATQAGPTNYGCLQPAFTDISGTAATGQIPNPAGDVIGTYAATTVTGTHWGGTSLPLSGTAPVNGQCLGISSSTIVGLTCGGATPAGPNLALQYDNSGVLGGIAEPTTPDGVTQILASKPSGGAILAAFGLPGVPVNAQAGTTYTFLTTDRGTVIKAVNSNPQTYTAVNPTTAGFGSNFMYLLLNQGTGTITENSSGFTINGVNSLLIPPNWNAWHWSDNTNYFVLRVPDYSVFPNTGAGNALTFNTSTGVFGTIAVGGGGGTPCTTTALSLQYNNSGSFGCVPDFTFSTPHTILAGVSGILDLSAASVTAGFKLPSAAGAAPTADGFPAVNTSNHTLVWGSNGTTIVGAAAATGTGTATDCGTTQVVTKVSAVAIPTCTTLANSFIPTGTVLWNQLGAPSGNLSLTMGANTSTFNTTSALSQMFAWKNTTAAVVGTSQGSPVLAFCGRAFHSSADVEDCLTLSELPGNGNDAAITATLGHSGTSTGVFTVNAANLNATTSLSVTATAPACTAGTAGASCELEGTAPTNVSGSTAAYADSTQHEELVATNGSSSFGMRVRRQPGAVHQTGKTAAISTATLCDTVAGACNVAGQYHVHFTFIETGTACGTPGTGGVTFLLTWTDTNGTTHSAISVGFDDASTINAVSQTFHFQTTLAAAWGSGDFNISTNGTIIQYATGYTACGVGTGTYQLDAVVTRLQ